MASSLSPNDATTRQLIVCRLATRIYGIELDAVREIIPFRRGTRLPGAPAYVAGLMNVRGTVVTVVDLGAQLEVTSAERTNGSVILIEHGSTVVGIAVDEVLDVRRLSDVESGVQGEDWTAGTEGNAAKSVRALGRLDGQVIVLLDIHDIISQVLA